MRGYLSDRVYGGGNLDRENNEEEEKKESACVCVQRMTRRKKGKLEEGISRGLPSNQLIHGLGNKRQDAEQQQGIKT